MRVVHATGFGSPDVLVAATVDDPVPGPGEVVVDVVAADVVFLDILIRRGVPGPWSVQPPYVPGIGVAGRVSMVGPEVDSSWIDRRVVGKPGAMPSGEGGGSVAETAAAMSPTGGYAERALLATPGLLPIPEQLDESTAAALINDGTTARQLVEAAKIQPGEWVLVTPAAAGLGSLLVQLVKSAGGRVIAGVGGPAVARSTPEAAALGKRKLAVAEERGAEAVVDYAESDWPDRVREATSGSGVDVVLDGVGGEVGRASFDATANGGRFFAFGAPGGGFAQIDEVAADSRKVTVTGLLQLALTPADMLRLSAEALDDAAAGTMSPLIGQSFELHAAADAHTAIESRAVLGKTLLLP